MSCHRVEFCSRKLRPKKLRFEVGRFSRFNSAFDPYLSGPTVLPVGKETHAVAARENVFEMIFQLPEGQILINNLSHDESRLNVQRDLGHDAKPTQSNDRPAKAFAILCP